MNSIKSLIIALLIPALYACTQTGTAIIEVNVSNKLAKARSSETIEIGLDEMAVLLTNHAAEELVVKDGDTDEILVSQLVDENGDGEHDLLLFQADLQANETKHYHIELIKPEDKRPEVVNSTYGRFVPERIDDFAWENDKVAFRTYGPTAQQMTESGKPGGTLSSGIDCWLKRVEYPIIDKWYKEDLEEGKSYHKDHGEGLDNYHVGPSRGTGGTGIWNDGELLISKNYQSWKIIANGPIRTTFELDYGTWDAGDMKVQEVKRISIDLGSNLYKNTLILGNHQELPNITLGVTLHEKAGEVKMDEAKGWFRYWEPHDGSELSTAIVVNPALVKEAIDHRVDEKDLSNLLVVCKPANEVEYYAGFAWAKSKQFGLPSGFDQYLADFAERLASPVEVHVGH